MSGRLEAIWLKRQRGGEMSAVSEATAEAGGGLAGDANYGRTRRQVTLIEKEVFDTLNDELGTSVDPALRRANLMVSGVSLADTRDRRIRIGGCVLQVRGETRPCTIMEEQLTGLRDALDPDWRGGVFCTVLSDARIQVGDVVTWED